MLHTSPATLPISTLDISPGIRGPGSSDTNDRSTSSSAGLLFPRSFELRLVALAGLADLFDLFVLLFAKAMPSNYVSLANDNTRRSRDCQSVGLAPPVSS